MNHLHTRRALMLAPAWLAGLPPLALAQKPGAAAAHAGRRPRMVQLIDTAATQQETARDYATGVRLAWARRGGATTPELVTLAVDTTRPGALTEAVQALRADASIVATVGIVGDTLAVNAIDAVRQAGLPLAHIGPWMADARHDPLDDVLALFPSRTTQLRHAVGTVRGMGIDQLAIVYPNQRELQLYSGEIDATARALGLAVRAMAPGPGEPLAAMAERLARVDGGLVLFVGGAAELAVLTQSMTERGVHRFVLSLSDVDLATLAQMPRGRNVPLILTQVVPNPATSRLPLAQEYRDALRQLYDEAPSPLGLAGMVAGLCALECHRRAGAGASREAMLAEVQRRRPMELGGFRLDFAAGRRGSGFVTHTLLRADGTLLG